MNILVTGGNGFIGTNLIKRLVSKGYKVYSLDDLSTGKKENEIDGCHYIYGDISNIDTIWEDIGIVYHMAARARIQPSFENPDEYFDSNVDGTRSVVKYCIKNKASLIYAGSSSHHSGRFKNPYTFTKDIGEDIITLYQTHFGLKSSTARFYNVYGPHQLTEGGYTTLIGRWLNNIEKGIPCEIYGDGEQRRDFTHVGDIVDALIKIMEQQAYGHIFELGRGENFSVNEVAKMFNITPIYKDSKPGEARNTLCESLLAKEKLNWYPKINLVDYIKSYFHENIINTTK